MANNLKTFSAEFKRDCLAFLLNDGIAAKTALHQLPDDFFEYDPEFNVIFIAYRDFLSKYSSRPSRHEMIDYLKDVATKGGLDEQKIRAILIAFDEICKWAAEGSFSSEYVKTKLYDAITSHEMLKVGRTMADLIDQGAYDEIVAGFSKARSCVLEEDPLVEYWTDANARVDRLRIKRAKVVPTGMPPVDKLIDGGMHRGGMGMVMGSSGHGKTAILGQLAVSASLQGYITAYITLEISGDEIMKRADSHNTGIPVSDIPVTKRAQLAQALHKSYTNCSPPPAPLFVQYFPQKSASVAQVEEFVVRLREERGVTLDLLVVDYLDILKMTGDFSKRYEALEENTAILRGLAGKYNMAIWTASQTNRTGVEKEVVGMEDMSGAYGKAFPLDLLITISQTRQERLQKVLRFHFAKNRFGPAGGIVYVDADFERMRFTALTEAEADAKGFTKKARKAPGGSHSSLSSFGKQAP